MIIKVRNVNDEIETTMITEDGKEKEFDYIYLLNTLYNKTPVTLSFEKVDKELEEKITDLFAEINSIQPYALSGE